MSPPEGTTNSCLQEAPYLNPELFIGRTAELDDIHQFLTQNSNQKSKPTILTIHGISGIGKTQLVLKYAEQYQDHYESVFWFDATSEASIRSSFHKIASSLIDSKAEDITVDEIVTDVKRRLSEPSASPRLLIFDNHGLSSISSIQDYYPDDLYGAIIITSCQDSEIVGLSLKLEELDVQSQSEILCLNQAEEQTRNKNQELIQRLHSHTLALSVTGALLHQSRWSIDFLVKEYDTKAEFKQSETEQLDSDTDNGRRLRTGHTILELSYCHLESKIPLAAKLLRLLAYFDRHVWYELLEAGAAQENSPAWLKAITKSSTSFGRIMGILVKYNLVQRQFDTGTFSIHPFIHDWALNHISNSAHADDMYWSAFDCVTGLIGQKAPRSAAFRFSHLAPLVPHTVRLTQHRFVSAPDPTILTKRRCELVHSTADLLTKQGQLTAAECMLEKAKIVFNQKHIAVTASELAWVYLVQEKEDQAEAMLQQAVIIDKSKKRTPQRILEAMHNLGELYSSQQKFAEAETAFLQARHRKEQELGILHPSTLTTISSLARLYARWDNNKKLAAETLFRQALLGREKVLGELHKTTLMTQHNFGAFYARCNRMAEAEQMYLQALNGRKVVLGKNHDLTLSTMYNLSLVLSQQGGEKLPEAERLLRDVLTQREKTLGDQHSCTVETLHELGIIYCRMQNSPEASKILRRALGAKEKIFGERHESTLRTVYNLALLYSYSRNKERATECEQLYLRAIVGGEQTLGERHAFTLQARRKLADLYNLQGRLGEAKAIYAHVRFGKAR